MVLRMICDTVLTPVNRCGNWPIFLPFAKSVDVGRLSPLDLLTMIVSVRDSLLSHQPVCFDICQWEWWLCGDDSKQYTWATVPLLSLIPAPVNSEHHTSCARSHRQTTRGIYYYPSGLLCLLLWKHGFRRPKCTGNIVLEDSRNLI